MTSRIVVVGASAGGMTALKRLVAQLPEDFSATLFVVRHLSPSSTARPLVRALTEAGHLPVSEARDGAPFAAGHIYLAPADHHLLVSEDIMRVTKRAHENCARPAIDPLFRSAAVAYRGRVIGVILSGYLNGGTAGLNAVHRCGGICVVQRPACAEYPDMRQNALNGTEVDHVASLAEIGGLLAELVRAAPSAPGHKTKASVPEDIAIEARIAERVLSDLPAVNALGEQAPFNCPDCGGVLWQVVAGTTPRFRCHTGHAFTSEALLAAQSDHIEETLWVALRMFEERRNLLLSMGSRYGASTSSGARAKESEVHIDRIRAMLKSNHRGC